MKKLIISLILLSFLPLFSWGQPSTTGSSFVWVGGYEIVGSDTLMLNSLTGQGDPSYVLTYCADQLTNINNGYISQKSRCRINGWAVCTMWFTDSAYAHQSFFKIENHTFNSDSTEALPNRITRYVHYTSALTGEDLTANTLYYSVPTYPTTPRTVGVGQTYSTISAAITAAGVNADTIIVYRGTYDETNYVYWRYQNIWAIDSCAIQSTGVSYVVLVSAENNVTFKGFEVDAESNTGTGFTITATVNQKHIYNCYIKNPTTSVIDISSNSAQTIYFSINNCAFSSALKRLYTSENTIVNDCYFYNTYFFTYANVDYYKLFNNDFYCYGATTASIVAPSQALVEVKYNSFNLELARNAFYANQTGGAYSNTHNILYNVFNSDSVVTATIQYAGAGVSNININNNSFNNTGGGLISNITTNVFNTLYINNNEFYTTGGKMFPTNLSTTAQANSIHMNNNISTNNWTEGYGFAVGTETSGASDNKVDTIFINGNLVRGARYYNPTSNNTSHGIFVGFLSPKYGEMKYNYCDGNGIGYVFKGSTGTSMNNIDISYNVSRNSNSYGFYSKGVDSLNLYNLTSYASQYSYYFSINTGSDPAYRCSLINCIGYPRSTGSSYVYATDATSDTFLTVNYNVAYNPDDNISLLGVTPYSWETWQELGYDANSYNANPQYTSSTQLWPVGSSPALSHGLNLGTTYQSGLASNTLFPNPTLRNQGTTWTIGAYVVPEIIIITHDYIISKKGFIIIKKGFIFQKEDTMSSTINVPEDTRIYILRCNTILNCNSVIKKSTAFIDNFNWNYNNLSKEFKKEELYV